MPRLPPGSLRIDLVLSAKLGRKLDKARGDALRGPYARELVRRGLEKPVRRRKEKP